MIRVLDEPLDGVDYTASIGRDLEPQRGYTDRTVLRFDALPIKILTMNHFGVHSGSRPSM